MTDIIIWFKRLFGMNDEEKIGFYVCSLVDILGQKEKLKSLYGMDLASKQGDALAIFRNTYGVIKKFRQYTVESIDFVNSMKTKNSLQHSFSSNPVKTKPFSDLVTSYVLLGDNKHKLQFEGIYFLLLSNCEVFLRVLADGVGAKGWNRYWFGNKK